MVQFPLLFAYFSPETVLPLSSMLATVAGCALMVKRSSLRFVARGLRAPFLRARAAREAGSPHFKLPDGGRPGHRLVSRGSSRSTI
jgi:hypothetical protein